MKKLESTWYNMLIVLTLIAVVAGAALGFVNQKTSPLISDNDAKAEAAGVIEVLKAENVEVQRKDTVGNSIVYRTDKGIAVKAEDADAIIARFNEKAASFETDPYKKAGAAPLKAYKIGHVEKAEKDLGEDLKGSHEATKLI